MFIKFFNILDVLYSVLLYYIFGRQMDPAEQNRVRGRLALITGASGGYGTLILFCFIYEF